MIHRLKREKESLENAASKLLSLAAKEGATSAEVCASFGAKTKISLEKQDYHMATSDDSYALGLRILVGQKQGFASGNSIDTTDLKSISHKAIELARLSPENPHYAIEGSENTPTEAPSDLWDDPLHDLSLQTQKEWTKLMADEATRDSRFRLNEGSLTISSGLYFVLNSRGTHKLERETNLVWSLMGMGVEGENITSFDYFQELARKSAGVPEKIVSSTRRFRDLVIDSLQAGNAESYKGPVIFSPRAVADIFLSRLAYHLNGRNIVEGTSRWTIGDVGKSVLSPLLSLWDMPWLVDRFGCATFDREGVPTRNMPLIEGGQLKNFMLDYYAANALSQKSTGHAVGGPSSLPTVSAHTLVAGAGTLPLHELIGRAREERSDFLKVHRFSGQVDPVTGDFSGVAKGGEWWHNGERVHFVKETLISGNLFESLGTSLMGVSKESAIVDSQEECPTLLVDNVSVTHGR